ncbi:MAG TPA: NAD(P)-dependent oxidoreductase [Nitrososphaerales archaeon]|nr:NAD(P)-dependent oxidoreductase [Nitrososphaerales archaeon]
MRVLVTGAAGFIGSHIMREFSKRGFDVAGTDQTALKGILQADITELEQIAAVIERTKPDAVIHLAAISGTTGKNEAEQSLRQPILNFRVNVLGTANICEACRIRSVRKLIYMSSFAVYGRTEADRLPITEKTPTSTEHAYAVSKLGGEEVVRTYSNDFGIKSAIFRAPFIVGEHQKEKNVLREFVECAEGGKSLVIHGDGKHVREFVHPTDLADAFVRALDFLDGDAVSELFVIGNKGVAIVDLAGKTLEHIGRGQIEHLQSSTARTFDQYCDYSKATSLLGWKPRLSTDDIIDKIISTEYTNLAGTDVVANEP